MPTKKIVNNILGSTPTGLPNVSEKIGPMGMDMKELSKKAVGEYEEEDH